MVHIATVLGKTGEQGSQREILVSDWEAGWRNVDRNLLGKMKDIHWPEQLASFTSLIGTHSRTCIVNFLSAVKLD
jgi:hypothetical protein